MIAIDTNVVIRVVVADDPEQAARARSLVTSQDVFVPTSVLLEAEWVLRSVYGLPKPRIFAALRGFLALPHVASENRAAAFQALNWAEKRMDFADALHLAASVDCQAFASFDLKLARVATRTDAIPVREP